MGQARVVIGVDAAEALLFSEMISYFIASRPLAHPGTNSGPRPSGNGTWDLPVPSPDTAEAERPIMRPSPDGPISHGQLSSFIAASSEGAARSRADIMTGGSGQGMARSGSSKAIDTSSAGSCGRSMR
jgi:hypothetical protein